MGRIKIATAEQRAEYLETKPVYPLHGYLTLDGVTCYVEDLRGAWDKDNPQWELVMPEGHRLRDHCLHSLLGFTQADLIQRIAGDTVEKCPPGCDCGWDADD